MKVRAGGYNEFPYLVPRWAKATGEIYGRSPSYNALPDIKTLNKAVEIGLKAWAKAIDPPLLVQDDGVVGRVRTTPAGITVIRNDGAIKPLQTGSNWQITDMKETQLRTAIRQAYYSDQLQLQEGPQMTATEVQVRYELMQRLLGPTLGRFQSEFLNPLIERVFGIMFRSIMDNINHDEAIRMRATLLGVPKSILVSRDDVAEKREAQQQAAMEQQMLMAQQQQAQTGKMQADAAKATADPDVQDVMSEATAQAEQELM